MFKVVKKMSGDNFRNNFRNIVHFLKRILQVVDNAVFWQNVLLYFENDPLSPSF